MPSYKPTIIFKLLKAFGRKALPKFLCVVISLLAICFVIIRMSNERLIHKSDNQITKKLILSQKEDVLKEDLKRFKIQKKEDYDEWCSARDYQDLSNDPVFQSFNDWVEGYQKKDDHFHDLKKARKFYQQGLDLALYRAKILGKIIRGDPQKAINLALDEKTISALPKWLEPHLEEWTSEFIDLETIHVCFDPNHPTGLFKMHSKFPDGKKLRTWTYGARKKFPSTKGLSAWGIRLGEDFAMSDAPYRKKVNLHGKKVIQYGNVSLPFEKEYEGEFFASELIESERRHRGATYNVRYPMVASSSGATDYYEKKITFI